MGKETVLIDKKSGWITAVLFFVSLVGLGGTHHYLEQRRAAVQTLQNDIASLQARLGEDEEAEEILAKLGEAFVGGFGQGWWQPQNRIAWLEAARASAEQLGLPRIGYRLQPQEIDDTQGDWNLIRTAIDLDMGLVHEGQLLAFWHAIDSSGLGFFSLEACRIERGTDQPAPRQVNLTANCKMDWYAIVKEAASEA